MTAAAKDTRKFTEAEMLGLLRARYAADGRAGVDAAAWAFLSHVRDQPSYEAGGTIDALALGLWKSRGYELHGHEVKVSRSDWLREVKDPQKAERFIRRCDRWWIVAPRGIVHPMELPAGWGLMETYGTASASLRVTVQADRMPRTDEEKTTDRAWLVCLLKAASNDDALRSATAAGLKEGIKQTEERLRLQLANQAETTRALRQAEEQRAALLKALGLEVWRSSDEVIAKYVEQIGAALKITSTFEKAAAAARAHAKYLADLANQLDPPKDAAVEVTSAPGSTVGVIR